ncbi:MAG: O-antigen ligase family protein [Bacteriovoracaceae bacterium]|nr:O-antigen ligase family protein [Bacteriovoracaceae bacterium]
MIDPKFNVAKVIEGCSVILILLIFLSKVSFKWIPFFPYSLPPLIYQYGMHPYINFGIQFFLALILGFFWLKRKSPYPMSGTYKIFIYSLISVISIQTLFQISLVNVTQSVLVQLGGLGMAITLIILYGVIIPSLFPLEKFIYWVTKISSTLVIGSFLALPFFLPVMFRGGRFIGFFKHIPHMVTASTTAFIFFFPLLFQDRKWTLRNNTPLYIIGITILALSVLATSTKAAFVTIAMSGFIGILIYGSKKKSIRLFKFTFLSCILISILLIGAPISKLMYEVTTGKAGFGLRPAQDGIASRMDEVTRGWDIFEKSPYFGHGILYKFFSGAKEGIEIEGYNSFKDPHNLFISAGVIGGYPLILISVLAYFLMIAGVIRGLKAESIFRQTVALFLLAHLPVFIIYHASFSIGGMGDRIYYLVFGYLGQDWVYIDQKQPINLT